MFSPDISIILPVYNVAAYIERCMVSVMEQTYTNYEIVLVDDCSPDNSIDLAIKIFEKYQFSNYQLIRHKVNGGAAVARNTGLQAAKGEYIYFMDNDDYAETNLLEHLVQPFKDPDIDITVCNYWKIIMETGIKEEGFISPFVGKVPMVQALGAWVDDKEHSYVWRNLYKRKVLQNIQFAEKVVFEDVMTVPLIWANAKNIFFTPELLYNYIQRKGSVTTNWRKAEWFYHIVDYMKRNESYFKASTQLSNLYKRLLILHYSMLRNFSLQLASGDQNFTFYKEQLEKYRSHIQLTEVLQFPLAKNFKLIYQLLTLKAGSYIFWKRYRVKSDH